MKQKTVLFVDDDEKLLASLARVVVDEPYEALFAKSGQDAVAVLRSRQVHVIVADMLMPGMGGLELLRLVKRQHPQVVRLVLSGDGEMDTLLAAINEGEVLKFIPKPWQSNDELRAAIHRALKLYDLQTSETPSCASRR